MQPNQSDLHPQGGFVIATGIECSAPIIAGGKRMDQLAKTRHYQQLEADIALVADLGVEHLRYGVPFHLTNPAQGVFDWSISDRALAACLTYGVTPLVDLVHFGVPDDLTGFDDPSLPDRVAEYARCFAQRYPLVRHYTVVNEPLITSTFSARMGIWNEQRVGDEAFVKTMLNVCRAAVRGVEEVRRVNPDAVFLQSDSCESYHPVSIESISAAELLNELRFLGYELIFGRPLSRLVTEYLLEHGAGTEDLEWFQRRGTDENAIVGNDYYAACEKEVRADGSLVTCGERSGYYGLAREYHQRLKLPFMASETNNAESDGREWLRRQWTDVVRLRQEGYPIRGFTWYGFINHVDWDTLLTVDNGTENQLGLVDLERRPTPIYGDFSAIVSGHRRPEFQPTGA